ncbi:hypothetical protein KC336_g22082, partial [Hortaea werneckii]
MRLLALPSMLASLALSSAIPTIGRLTSDASKPLPLLIWHGLGDTYDADGLRETGKLVEQLHPGTYVYYVRVAESSTEDRTGTFFGNITTQIAQVCKDIHSDS